MFLTDADIFKRDLFSKVNSAIQEIQSKLQANRKKSILKSKAIEIVLDSDDFEGTDWKDWNYYCIDKETRHLFWLDEHTLDTAVYQGPESNTRIGKSHPVLVYRVAEYNLALCVGILLQVEYYQHLSLFPHEQSLGENFFDEMKGILVWGLAGEFLKKYLKRNCAEDWH